MEFPFEGTPGMEAVVMWLDGQRFVRKGWFFSNFEKMEKDVVNRHYGDDADKLIPNWKTARVESWYFLDGWKKRTQECGQVRE